MVATNSGRAEAYSRLADLGSAQGGYVLARQAAALGIDRFRLGRLEGQGVLERDSRGLYRLVAHPISDDSELWAALLWAGVRDDEPDATLSDETALSMYDISTINPTRIDLTIPKRARLRRRAVPARYRLQHRSYAPSDLTRVRGLPTTTLARTLLDLILAKRAFQFVDEALENAPARGILTTREATTLRGLRFGDPGLIDALRRS
ncbi:MAG TPA: type IV toxin-antitoxin system AbiEi family antitoxin domain-containing protein [Candidatus Elarobacter sp.]|jgi:predicted transcriptional regulator of viral defense system|nr:type IV toxin-antitoxin system AbiEi family antitoxin domain-containing protein [Candidatus Elarobacter sp.]